MFLKKKEKVIRPCTVQTNIMLCCESNETFIVQIFSICLKVRKWNIDGGFCCALLLLLLRVNNQGCQETNYSGQFSPTIPTFCKMFCELNIKRERINEYLKWLKEEKQGTFEAYVLVVLAGSVGRFSHFHC